MKGGQREGAGRKSGAATKKTRDIADKLAADAEITPLEVMVQTMRELWAQAQAARGEHRGSRMVAAAQIAEKAAPYVHPRLSALKVDADIESRIQRQLGSLSDEELFAEMGALTKQLGWSLVRTDDDTHH